jgi:hypothetical protein
MFIKQRNLLYPLHSSHFGPIAHGLKVAMKLIAYGLDDTPPMRYRAFIAVHVNLRIDTNVAALVEFISNPCIILAKSLVGAPVIGSRLAAFHDSMRHSCSKDFHLE